MILNIHNPIPILQQKPSSITTNIPPKNFQRTTDKSTININEISKKNNETSINQKISSNIIEFFNDFYEKPIDKSWLEYIIEISSKKNRLLYIGIFFILISGSILLELFKKN